MTINPAKVKTGVFGIQGSGKTFIVEKDIVTQFKNPFVYLLHPEDFRGNKKNVNVYIPKKIVKGKSMIDRSPEHLDMVLGQIIEVAKKGKIDGFILDEASTFLPKDLRTLQKYPNIIDLVDNHRHYGLGFVYMARRPQSIATEIVETSEFIFLFAIEGKNVKEHFRMIHSDYEELIPKLSKAQHNFIFKELGKPPQLFGAITVRSVKKK